MSRYLWVEIALALCLGGLFAEPAREIVAGELQSMTYSITQIGGWTIHINSALLENEKAPTDRALELLQKQLQEIARVLPSKAVTRLREVQLWFSPEYPGLKPKAEYHPGADWLREHGRDPAMVKGVEFTDIHEFEREMNRMPNFALHELAHAYHDRVLPDGFENEEIKATFEKAKASRKYDRVERWFGNGKPNTFERAYAITSPQEYFAESSEAFFSRKIIVLTFNLIRSWRTSRYRYAHTDLVLDFEEKP